MIYDISDDPKSARIKTVLVLEDDGAFATTLKEVLQEQGYQLTVVSSGAQGLREILAEDFDAIVCDIMMPRYPGDVFYVALQKVKPHLCDRVIFITGYQSDPQVAAFVKKSGRPVLWKPFKLEELFDTLETITVRKH